MEKQEKNFRAYLISAVNKKNRSYDTGSKKWRGTVNKITGRLGCKTNINNLSL